MPSCSVFWCKKRSQTSNQQKDDITFHLFPKDIGIRSVWVKACGNHESWTPKRTSTICSAHFVTSCFIIQSNNKRRLKQGFIPTLKLLSEFQSCEKSEGEQEPERKKLKTPQPVQTEEGATSKLKTHSSEHNICIATTSTVNPQLLDTPRKIKLKKQLQVKNKQIKRLQSQKSYLKKKVAGQVIK